MLRSKPKVTAYKGRRPPDPPPTRQGRRPLPGTTPTAKKRPARTKKPAAVRTGAKAVAAAPTPRTAAGGRLHGDAAARKRKQAARRAELAAQDAAEMTGKPRLATRRTGSKKKGGFGT